MTDRLYIYHAISQLATPLPGGKPKEFSCEFIPASGKRKGQKLFIKRAVINHFSSQKTADKLEKSSLKKGEDEGAMTTQKGRHNRIEKHLVTIRVLESDDVKDKIVSPKLLYITRINGLKTYI